MVLPAAAILMRPALPDTKPSTSYLLSPDCKKSGPATFRRAVFGLFLEIPLTVFGRMPPLPVQIFLTVAIVVEIIFFIRYLLAMGRAHRLWPGVR